MTLDHIEIPETESIDPSTINWNDLSFKYTQTRSYILYKCVDGKWDQGTLVKNPYVPTHIAAGALHYGQAIIEGLRAFRQQSGRIVVFRPRDSAKRLISSCARIVMPAPPEEMFMQALQRLLKDNVDFIPPYASNGSLYIRPLVFGSGPQLGVAPSTEYTFIMFGIPAGCFYKNGLTKGLKCKVVQDSDRAAPRGTGDIKMAGNYAASMQSHVISMNDGYAMELYLDAKTNSKIEEFTSSNFFGIKVVQDSAQQNQRDQQDNNAVPTKIIEYHTPCSPSILPSITNDTLQQICQSYLKWKVIKRDIFVNELSQFDEVGATGTAVVVSPVSQIDCGEDKFTFKDGVGENTLKLYQIVQDIQFGRVEDKMGWCWELE